jgi:type VI secretion system protein ImpL
MFALLKRRVVLVVLGLLLLSLIIWFFGDRFFDFLETDASRVAAIAILVALFALVEMFRRTRAAQANNQLAAAVVGQAKTDQRPSADVVQLRERFEEALATLKQQKKRGGLGLYEMPWYVIIGAPGSGKTTALRYSGLKFPLEQRSGRGALRGVGGTRNCDWWFTEEAVLLDTAGRYTTQDSDASADSAGWAEFLTLLKTHRKRRPLNGVLLAISAHDLITQGQAGREAHVAAARRRLAELNKELRVELPVYVLVTKCDLLAGFSEYFEDMSQEDRAQVFGVTFAKEVTFSGKAAAAFPEEFDAVVERLNQRLVSRLEDERDVRRRARIFGFPQQIAALREGLADFIAEVFESTRFDQRALLRGVYFTSGTQEGTPIDRLLGALGRRLAVSADAAVAPGKGKSYFIERVIKQVVLAESGLAVASRRLEIQKAAAQFGLYIGMLAAGIILLLLLTYSYRTNGQFLASFKTHAAAVSERIPASGNSAMAALPRLDTLRTLRADARAYRENTSWLSRGWGLDQSDWVEDDINSVYRGELNRALVSTVRARVEQRLESLLAKGGDPLDLYLSLRAYLMLRDTGTSHFYPDEVRDVAKKEWAALYPGNDEDIQKLDDHFNSLLQSGLPASDINEELVTRTRRAIPDDAAPRLILAYLGSEYQSKHKDEPLLFEGQAIRNRKGRVLDEGLPKIFTEPGFRAADNLIKDSEEKFRSEVWVWQGDAPKASKIDRREEVRQLYQQEYIRRWDEIVAGIGLPSAVGDALIELINKVSNERTGLKQLLLIVDKHTYLVPPPDEKTAPSLLSSPGAYLGDYASWLSLALQGKKAELGTEITKHFSPIHGLVSPIGGKAPLVDELVSKMKDMGNKLQAAKPGVIGAPPPAGAAAELAQKAKELQQSATGLPGPAAGIGTLITDLSRSAEKASGGQLENSIANQFQGVLRQCREKIGNRYPFYPDSPDDMLLGDFKDLFGPEGAFAKFASEVLKDYVEDRGGGVLVPKQLPTGAPLNIGAILNTVNSAERIRQAFFPKGQVRFRVQVVELDAYKFQLDEYLFEDGAPLIEEGTSTRPKLAVWPTRAGPIQARFTVDRMGATQSVPGGDGPWAFFRLLEKGSLVQEGEASFKVRLEKGDNSVTLRITPESLTNPLTLIKNGSLRNFKCGG